MSLFLILFHNIDIVLWYYGDIKNNTIQSPPKMLASWNVIKSLSWITLRERWGRQNQPSHGVGWRARRGKGSWWGTGRSRLWPQRPSVCTYWTHTYRLSQSVSSSASQTCPGHTNVAGQGVLQDRFGKHCSRESGVNIPCTVYWSG